MEGDVLYVIKYWMGGEISNFIKVWLSVYASLCYCYFTAKIVPKGVQRFLAYLPVVCLFFYLPLTLYSMNLGGFTSFLVGWLANFKILLFAFNKGPLADPLISLPRFIVIGSLPIEIQQNKPSKFDHNSEKIHTQSLIKGQKSLSHYAKKVLLLAIVLKICYHREHINHNILKVIYFFSIYFTLELVLVVNAALARGLLGVELESQFEEPFLSTSLQDFWGRRWNLMVTRILRPSVYDPIYELSCKILGRKWAPLPAIMATFIVSALMHELIFYYLGRLMPTWEITWFFLLHGVSLMIEVVLKKELKGKIYLPRFVGTIFTVLYIMTTGLWLFFPQLLRCKADAKAFDEYLLVVEFMKDLGKALSIATS